MLDTHCRIVLFAVTIINFGHVEFFLQEERYARHMLQLAQQKLETYFRIAEGKLKQFTGLQQLIGKCHAH